MAFFRRWVLILLALALGGAQVMAAGTRQERAFMAAKAAFDAEMWSRAEAEFAVFAAKYPNADATPMARLLQAQAEINQGNYTNAIQLLSLNRMKAGKLADQYVKWIGEAQYADADFSAAAQTFTAVADQFTNSPLRFAATVKAAAALGRTGPMAAGGTLVGRPQWCVSGRTAGRCRQPAGVAWSIIAGAGQI